MTQPKKRGAGHRMNAGLRLPGQVIDHVGSQTSLLGERFVEAFHGLAVRLRWPLRRMRKCLAVTRGMLGCPPENFVDRAFVHGFPLTCLVVEPSRFPPAVVRPMQQRLPLPWPARRSPGSQFRLICATCRRMAFHRAIWR